MSFSIQELIQKTQSAIQQREQALQNVARELSSYKEALDERCNEHAQLKKQAENLEKAIAKKQKLLEQEIKDKELINQQLYEIQRKYKISIYQLKQVEQSHEKKSEDQLQAVIFGEEVKQETESQKQIDVFEKYYSKSSSEFNTMPDFN